MEIKKKFILTIVLLSYLATAINGAIVIYYCPLNFIEQHKN